MTKSTYVGLWLGVSACTFNLDVNTVDGPVNRLDAMVPDDGAVPDVDAAEPDAASPIRHAACESALPVPLPEPPAVRSNASGRPAFDLWRELDCRTLVDYPLCSPSSMVPTAGWRCDACVLGAGDAGVCAGMDGSCALLTSRDGQCQGCAPVAAKARACCLAIPGFDCRTWPFAVDSRRGEACARHEDCEQGLVCKQGQGDPHGRCFCPEVSPGKLEGFACTPESSEAP